MSPCTHPEFEIEGTVDNERLERDDGLPRQISFLAYCQECGEKVTIDYNIATVDGGQV